MREPTFEQITMAAIAFVGNDMWDSLDKFGKAKARTRARTALIAAAPSPSPAPGVVEALRGLLDRDERNTCQHEETHRGGFLWEICDQCGAKWADDQGGKPEWKDPPEWIAARDALASLSQPAKEREGGREYFHEPAERGRLCVIRFRAPHYTGRGEVVARNVELELAKRICSLLNGGRPA